MQNIDLSEIVHVLNVLGIVTSNHLNLSTILCHFLSAKVSPQCMEVRAGFWDPEKNVSFPE